MTLGIGLYAPCMILVSLLGMNDDDGLPDHDGVVRVPDAGGSPCASCARGATTCARRSGWRSAGTPAVLIAGLHRERAAAHGREVAGRRRRGLHCDRDASLGGAGRRTGRREMGNPLFAIKSVTQLRAEAEGHHGLKRTLGPVRPDRARHRRHHRRRPVRAHRRGRRRTTPARRSTLGLHRRRRRLRVRRPLLRRVRLDDPDRRQRLHLLVRDDGRAGRLDHRLGPGPRVRGRRRDRRRSPGASTSTRCSSCFGLHIPYAWCHSPFESGIDRHRRVARDHEPAGALHPPACCRCC